VLRDLAFDGGARIRCLIGERDPATRVLPDIEGVCLDQGSRAAKGATLFLTLPPHSFTVIEPEMIQ
jgi:hypothetical protein